MIERCRETYSVQMMCRRLGVSTSGYYGWRKRPPSARAQDNLRLVERITGLHAESGGVLGSPRIWEGLRYEGEICSKNRVACLMRVSDLNGIPVKGKHPRKKSGSRPDGVRKYLARDCNSGEPKING